VHVKNYTIQTGLEFPTVTMSTYMGNQRYSATTNSTTLGCGAIMSRTQLGDSSQEEGNNGGGEQDA
jgi:hypothetical protein